ncbi:MAG TPA: methyl-accepting chemotaxis protein [Candidatus Polarisedimenticolaceae bacterium]|nr:methyl-accepting chemotaxis protein [Candidatus Polarisedimenticolaceae bacterium]
MQKKLAASFLLVTFLCTLVAVVVPRFQEDAVWATALVVCLDMAIGLGGAWLVSWLVVRRIKALAAATTVISRGDLTQVVSIDGADETAELARSFSTMLANLLTVLKEVRATAERIHDSAASLSTTSESVDAATEGIAEATRTIAQGADRQAEDVTRTSALTRDLNGAVDRVADAAKAVHTAAENAAERAHAGSAAARRAADGIVEVSRAVDASANAVDGFQGRADEIGKIVTFIVSLAEQTHLLAINATIEASRAGEEARGFAVVAEEVRRLADHVRGFADQISSVADEIRGGSHTIATSIRDSARAAGEARALVDRASAAFDGVLEATRGTTERARAIDRSAEEQRSLARQLDEAQKRIVDVARDNARSSVETSAATSGQSISVQALSSSARDLARTSDQLKELLATFRLRD